MVVRFVFYQIREAVWFGRRELLRDESEDDPVVLSCAPIDESTIEDDVSTQLRRAN